MKLQWLDFARSSIGHNNDGKIHARITQLESNEWKLEFSQFAESSSYISRETAKKATQ